MIIIEITKFVYVYVGESLINSGKNNFTLVINEGQILFGKKLSAD
jgi:hypothetical protein